MSEKVKDETPYKSLISQCLSKSEDEWVTSKDKEFSEAALKGETFTYFT